MTKNGILTARERETVLSRFADYKHNKDKYATTKNGEAVIYSFETPIVIAYIKGTIEEPVITRIVRINSNDFCSDIAEVVLYYERRGNNVPWEYVENAFGEKIFNSYDSRDFASFRSYQAGGERRSGEEGNTDYREVGNGKRSVQQNKADDRADDLTSAFSMPETEYSIDEEQPNIPKGMQERQFAKSRREGKDLNDEMQEEKCQSSLLTSV